MFVVNQQVTVESTSNTKDLGGTVIANDGSREAIFNLRLRNGITIDVDIYICGYEVTTTEA